MNLERYREKRRFSRTTEPAGGEDVGESAPGDRRIYVVQKHLSSHLHYDLRLEWGGVLKSWAVPKGPSLDPGDKRLAVEVEDHPLDYAEFEGVIPAGEYGAGPVIIWDRGYYRGKPPQADFGEMMSDGRIKLNIHGEKIKGGYMLVRTGWGGKKNNWLLIKEKDGEARPGYGIVAEEPLSVVSGKDVTSVI